MDRDEQRRYIASFKKDKTCMDCGYSYGPTLLTFDHVPNRGKKLFNLSMGYLGDLTLAVLEAEIAKTDLVCHCCHKVREARRKKYDQTAFELLPPCKQCGVSWARCATTLSDFVKDGRLKSERRCLNCHVFNTNQHKVK